MVKRGGEEGCSSGCILGEGGRKRRLGKILVLSISVARCRKLLGRLRRNWKYDVLAHIDPLKLNTERRRGM